MIYEINVELNSYISSKGPAWFELNSAEELESILI